MSARRTRLAKSVVAALSIALLAAACAPAAGRATVSYLAEPSEIVTTLARQASRLTPPDGYNYFSIESINDTGVTLRADPVVGLSVVAFVAGVPTEPARVTITTFADGAETVVAISVFPSRLEEVYQSVIALLDDSFGRPLSLPGGGTINAP